jgi:23S rRNA pseudouridine2605 synthase
LYFTPDQGILFAMETKQRLSKVLAGAGVASRRQCEELVFEGKVTVNGVITLLPQTLVSLKGDSICVEKRKISAEEKKLYFLLNKPKGYICSNARVGTKRIVRDLFGAISERLFTVGRLDRETTGLLIVTNDGHFSNKVIHPSSNITKEYLVKTQQEPFHKQLLQISAGIDIDGDWVKPVKVTKVRKGTLKIVVKEGKKREVRLLVQQTGLEVLELKRIRIGGLLLGEIPEGSYKEMSEAERQAIFS